MTQGEIIEMAIQGHAGTRNAIRWAMQQEREACAKVVDDIQARCIAKDVCDPPLDIVAEAIRERKQA